MSREKIEILCIDDDLDDIEIFQEAVSLTGLETNVRNAMNDVQLFDYFKLMLEPNIIFLDGSVTCHHEHNCLEQIKAQEHLAAIPVIILSTIGLDSRVNNMYERGASLFLIKPSSLPELTNLLATTLNIDWKTNTIDSIKQNFASQYPSMKFPKAISSI